MWYFIIKNQQHFFLRLSMIISVSNDPIFMPIASFFGSISFSSILLFIASDKAVNRWSMFCPDFAEHYIKSILFFFAS